VFYFGVSANWVVILPLNSAITAALFGLAALASPPFRPQFLSATTVLSELFWKTLVFFRSGSLSMIAGPGLKYYRQTLGLLEPECYNLLN
jgi:hypothetical protein